MIAVLVVFVLVYGILPAALAAYYLPGSKLSDYLPFLNEMFPRMDSEQDTLLPVDIKVKSVKVTKQGEFTATVVIYNHFDEIYRLDSLDFYHESIGDDVKIFQTVPAFDSKDLEKGNYQSVYFDDVKLRPDEPRKITIKGRSKGDLQTLLITVYVKENDRYKSELLRIIR